MNKELISSRFHKTRESYHKDAVIQKEIAEELYSQLKEIIDSEKYNLSENIKTLEIGCGSGFFTRKYLPYLKSKTESMQVILNDIAGCPDSLVTTLTSKNIDYCFINDDAENYYFDRDFDIILSSSAIQWFKRPDLFLKNIEKNLKDSGLIAISTFLPDNMSEIKDIINIGLDYCSEQTLLESLNDDFNILSIKSEIKKIYFNSPIHVLHHMKKTGVNGITEFRWNKSKLENFSNLYNEKYGFEGKVSLTYNPVYIIAQKKLR